MSGFALPPYLVDPVTLPPVIMTSEPGSFAHNTLRVRVPAILQETRALNTYPAAIDAALGELYTELTAGQVRGLREAAADRPFWDAACAPWLGRSWLAVPWYWAEAYYYRRVLEAARYFQPGSWQGRDPYATKKRVEWAPDAAPAAVETLLSSLPGEPDARFGRLLHASLWGNRTDLSYTVAAHLGRAGSSRDERDNLVADETAAVWRWLQTVSSARADRAPRRVALIADNAGTELLMDLALIDGLLTGGLANEVYLHLKPQPFLSPTPCQTTCLPGWRRWKAAGRGHVVWLPGCAVI